MPFKIDFWKDFGGFWEGKWRQVGTQIDQKSMPIAKSDFLKNRALPAVGAWFFRFGGSKLGANIDQKSIKKRSQDGKATWHRFFIDFGGFGDPSWEAKSSQDRSKTASKKRWKKEERPHGKKVAIRSSNVARGRGSGVQGRSPPTRRDSPLGPTWKADLPLKSPKVLYSILQYLNVLYRPLKYSKVI